MKHYREHEHGGTVKLGRGVLSADWRGVSDGGVEATDGNFVTEVDATCDCSALSTERGERVSQK